jgi:hypothetical protein
MEIHCARKLKAKLNTFCCDRIRKIVDLLNRCIEKQSIYVKNKINLTAL